MNEWSIKKFIVFFFFFDIRIERYEILKLLSINYNICYLVNFWIFSENSKKILKNQKHYKNNKSKERISFEVIDFKLSLPEVIFVFNLTLVIIFGVINSKTDIQVQDRVNIFCIRLFINIPSTMGWYVQYRVN